jgi:hypothetical protein
MVENPFLTPPQVESPQSRSWALGFLYGFQGPAESSIAQSDVGAEDADAFDEGVLAGQDTAINGLPLANACVDLNVERPTFSAEMASGLTEAGIALWETFKGVFAGGVLSGVMAVVELSMALETHFDDPDEAISRAGTDLQQQLANLGFSGSLELFIGGGVDINATGCELQLTPIHRQQEGAVNAASNGGRPQWLVASWRTDQSGGVTVVASSE